MVLVVAHLGVYSLAGAWVLLSAFFVASGYLITTILLREHGRSGRINAWKFYRRRAERLLPGLVLLLVTVSLWATLFASDATRRQVRGDVFATLGFVMNWRLIRQNDNYFGQFEEASYFRHAWTLAVEEQFYVLAPLLIGILLTLTRRKWRLWIIAVAALASTWWASTIGVQTVGDQARVYYGTDTRVAAVFIGVGMAFLLASGWRPPAWALKVISPVALLLIIVAVWQVDAMSVFMFEQGGLLGFSLVAAVAIQATTDRRDNLVQRLFSFRPFVWCGVRVYGIYLWHWPMKLWLERSFPGWESWQIIVVGVGLSLVVAALSFRYIEEPVITGGIRALVPRISPRTTLIGSISTVVLLGAMVGRVPDAGTIEASDVPPLVSGAPDYVPDEKHTTVALYGDSVPHYLARDFPQQLYSDIDIVDLAEPGCSLVLLPVIWSGSYTADVEDICTRARERVTTNLAAERVDALVIMGGSTLALEHEVGGRVLDPTDPEFVERIRTELDGLHEAATDAGVNQVFVSTVPCRSDDTDGLDLIGPGVATHLASRPVLKSRLVDPAEVNEILTRWADDRNVGVLDLYDALRCNQEFTPRIHGFDLYRDYFHFSPQGAAMVWSWLVPEIRANWTDVSR